MACTIMVSTCQDKVHNFKSQSEKRWHKKRKIFINKSEPTTSRGYSSPCQGWISVCNGKDCERDQGSWAQCLNRQGPQWAQTTGIEDLTWVPPLLHCSHSLFPATSNISRWGWPTFIIQGCGNTRWILQELRKREKKCNWKKRQNPNIPVCHQSLLHIQLSGTCGDLWAVCCQQDG